MTTVDIPAQQQIALPVPSRVTQTTAVEQARAIAEVQAAVVVAQQCPRDMRRAEAEMVDACQRSALANAAFYTVPNRGHGPSIHLMRELARIWGNIDYSVRELRRDDDAGESEVLAYAWDVQTNSRNSRSFIAPHAKMAGRQRRALTDLNDIYLSNQNIGARAVRECIASVLPRWFTEKAQEICRATLEKGDGVPLQERITNMVDKFRAAGVSVEMLETKFGTKRGQWTAVEVADGSIAYTSITRDRIPVEEIFPPAPVTVAEITAQAGKTEPEAQP